MNILDCSKKLKITTNGQYLDFRQILIFCSLINVHKLFILNYKLHQINKLKNPTAVNNCIQNHFLSSTILDRREWNQSLSQMM